DPPEYRRDGIRPPELAELNGFDPGSFPDLTPDRAGGVLLELLRRPNIASKRGVFRQYDQQVLGNTVVQPGGDAAVLRVDGTITGIAVTTDCNARMCYLDPYTGGAAAVAEAARNLVCAGAVPIAVTDCLNFGDPQKPEVYFQLEQSVRGIARACERFGTPVVSGNVSLYNEAEGHAVYPTPVIGMLGFLEDVGHHLQAAFTRPDAAVFVLGSTLEQPVVSLAGSEYLETVHGRVGGMPAVDLDAEASLQALVLALHGKGLLLSAHDCSEGGLAVTVAESCLLGATGFESESAPAGRLDAALFGEAQGRIVVSTRAGEQAEEALLDAAAEHSVTAARLGHTTDGKRLRLGPIDLALDDLRTAYEALLA
ncbi:MAG: AIR synthase related protein, partial [Dehalococcoidia bacterium]